MGADGQERLLGSTVLLHGDAPLCASYLAAGGVGRLLYTGGSPAIGAHDPAFRMERAEPGAAADLVIDLGDGRAYAAAAGKRIRGGCRGGHLKLGGEPPPGPPGDAAAQALLESLAAGEAMRLLLGEEAHVYEFEVL